MMLSKNDILKLIKKIESLERRLNVANLTKNDKLKIKEQLNTFSSVIQNSIQNNKVDYNDVVKVDLKDVIEEVIQVESELIKLNLILLEILPEKYSNKIINVLNIEDKHKCLYQNLLDKYN